VKIEVSELLVLQACTTVNVGSCVWVEDPEVAWIDGEVIEVKGSDIKVKCTSGKTVCFTSLNHYLPINFSILKFYVCLFVCLYVE